MKKIKYTWDVFKLVFDMRVLQHKIEKWMTPFQEKIANQEFMSYMEVSRFNQMAIRLVQMKQWEDELRNQLPRSLRHFTK
jgi:hypothetical protein